MAIEYLSTVVGNYELERNTWYGHSARGQSASGYGAKITTPHWVRFDYDGKRYSRQVYATCYSNAASHWVIFQGRKLHLEG